MSWLFPLVYCIWFGSETYLIRRMRSSRGEHRADRGTLAMLWIVILAGNFSAVWITNRVHVPISTHAMVSWAGLAVIVAGVILRLRIIASLGRHFTVDVAIRKDHVLKTDGVYAYVRHPSYSASLLSFLGFGLSLNNWLSVALAFVPVLTAFLVRIRIEEKVLTGHFGEEYTAYKRKTRALIPFVV